MKAVENKRQRIIVAAVVVTIAVATWDKDPAKKKNVIKWIQFTLSAKCHPWTGMFALDRSYALTDAASSLIRSSKPIEHLSTTSHLEVLCFSMLVNC